MSSQDFKVVRGAVRRTNYEGVIFIGHKPILKYSAHVFGPGPQHVVFQETKFLGEGKKLSRAKQQDLKDNAKEMILRGFRKANGFTPIPNGL